jgi:hypothetical protein
MNRRRRAIACMALLLTLGASCPPRIQDWAWESGPRITIPERAVPDRVGVDAGVFVAIIVSGGRRQVVRSDWRSEEYDQCSDLAVNPATHELVYVVHTGEKSHLVVDGKPKDAVDSLIGFAFSGNGELAWSWRQERWCYLRFGGREFGPYRDVSAPVFRPGSGELAFAFCDDVGHAIQIGARTARMPKADSIRALRFDPTGRKLSAVIGDADGKDHFMVNGTDRGTYDGIYETLWSADGEGYAYHAVRNHAQYVVHDGKEFGPYDLVERLRFSRVGAHFAFAARERSGSVVVVNGAVLVRTKAWIRDCAVSDDGSTVAHIESYNVDLNRHEWTGEHFAVIDKPAGRRFGPFAGTALPVLSPKGTTFAFLAVVQEGNEQRVCMALDGVPLKPQRIYGEASFLDERCVQYVVQESGDIVGRGGDLVVVRGRK